eukprot:scaffold16110_cov148-Isochrysis_galbana.AAC.4
MAQYSEPCSLDPVKYPRTTEHAPHVPTRAGTGRTMRLKSTLMLPRQAYTVKAGPSRRGN